MLKRPIAGGVLIVLTIAAQGPAPNRPLTPGDQPDVQTFSRTVQGLRRSAQLTGVSASQADKLLEDAAALIRNNQSGEARRKLANAQALVTGKTWDAREEFIWSLALRPQRFAVEQSRPMILELAQMYAAAFPSSRGMRLRLALNTAERESKPVKQIGKFEVPVRDLIAEPLRLQVDLTGTVDGSYRLAADVLDGESPLVNLQQSFGIAEGIESRNGDVERRLAKIQGHESAKATVRWPFDIARVVNLGIRKLETTDFGLPESGTPTFDFAKELKDSAEVLKALESGKDPLVRAKGDHERHYYFEEANEIMPYRVYAPSNWDGKKQLPLLFVMHGATRDHNFYFDRDGGILAKLAEQHGYLVATTMGYRPNAGYNASAIGSLNGAGDSNGGSSAANPGGGRGAVSANRADDGGRGSPSNPDGAGGRGGFALTPALRRQTEMSEKDAMHTLDLVVKEFNPDPSRIYLFGHSAGGTGGWYIASKYPERFAGIALSAFGTQPQNVPWSSLKGLPILVIVGSKDAPRTVETARSMAKAVKEKGFETQFLEVPEATHDTIVGLALPTVYEFFSKHKRQ